MDYNKITQELKRKKMLHQDLARQMGITRQGLTAALRNKSLRVKDLESISEILDVPISYWWEEYQVNENKISYQSQDMIIKRLNRQIDNYLDDIKRFKERILELEIQPVRKKEAS